MLGWGVIERDFFAGGNLPKREEEHAPVSHATETIGRARMVDESGRVAAATGIDTRAIIELADVHLAAESHASCGLTIGNSFAHQLADFFPSGEGDRGEATPSIDVRFSGDQFHG